MSDEQELRRQNAALNEQIKLLVKTEQRLHRSQNEIDRQMTRVELLSRFALRWSSQSTAAEILAGAALLLRKLFNVDTVKVACRSPEPCRACAPHLQHDDILLVEASAVDRLAELMSPVVLTGDELAQLLGPASSALMPGPSRAERVAVVMPLREGEAPPSLFLIASSVPSARTSHLRESPSVKSLSFLQLMCSHVEHMLRNTRLLEDLAQSQCGLVAARDELEERVRLRTQELQAEIVERLRAEEQLIGARDAAEAASRAKSSFLANMSHELRTPLNAIIGYSEMLGEDAHRTGQVEVARDLGKIIAAGKHLLRLVSDVLDLSKIEAGRMLVIREPFDLQWLVRDVAATAQALAERNGNTLTLSAPDDLGLWVGDETRVTQVLLNLLGNAAKFTENGHIHLDVARSHDGTTERLVFRVTDTGIGMTADQQSRIFLDFVQADSSTTRRYGGTGLGLAISRRLCRLMGGDIVCDSAPERGSTFTVVLPAAPEAPAAADGRRGQPAA